MSARKRLNGVTRKGYLVWDSSHKGTYRRAKHGLIGRLHAATAHQTLTSGSKP